MNMKVSILYLVLVNFVECHYNPTEEIAPTNHGSGLQFTNNANSTTSPSSSKIESKKPSVPITTVPVASTSSPKSTSSAKSTVKPTSPVTTKSVQSTSASHVSSTIKITSSLAPPSTVSTHGPTVVSTSISPASATSSYVPFASTVSPTGTAEPVIIIECCEECIKLKKHLLTVGVFATVFFIVAVVLGVMLCRQVRISRENLYDPALSRLI